MEAIPAAAYAQFHNNSKEMLERGRDRFNIYCSPCHSQLGDGNGMIAQRGFSVKRPPGNYHTDRLRKMPIGHFYDVITNGYGVMTPRAFQVDQPDRWAIAAYIRVLQMSQAATPADIAEAQQVKSTNPSSSSTESGAEPR